MRFHLHLFWEKNLNLVLDTVSMDIQKGADEIYTVLQTALQTKQGALIGRNGTIELETVLFRLYGAGPNQPYPQHLSRRMELHAGIWPPSKESLDRWVFQLMESIRLSDVLVAGWYEPLKVRESEFLNTTNTHAPRIPLRSLEPYYVAPEQRWTQLLSGQRVAVLSSFAETMERQIESRDEVWPLATESLLPSDTEWVFLKTGYAPSLAQGVAEWPPGIQDWSAAVTHLVKEVVNSKASIALIGCGGLGMVLASELKKRGIIAIVLGGAIQVLFGIKGMRWQNHSVISHFWNDAWAWPKEHETPRGASLIENSCYWGKIEPQGV
jgi:hypothetical protein